jgi:small subunit ribosomal protein S8
MTNDLVSDMLTRIRNASLARHTFVRVKYSKLNLAILKVLNAEGYINAFQLDGTDSSDKLIKVDLKYKGWWIKKPLFANLNRISKPGQRVFAGYRNFDTLITTLKYEQGTAIISTSVGVMSHKKATQLKTGGEVLCYIG